jgi:hypothetical protein
MKVDIDFLNPAISGLKQQWKQLPEPVQDVLPYAGALHFSKLHLRHRKQQQLSSCGSCYCLLAGRRLVAAVTTATSTWTASVVLCSICMSQKTFLLRLPPQRHTTCTLHELRHCKSVLLWASFGSTLALATHTQRNSHCGAAGVRIQFWQVAGYEIALALPVLLQSLLAGVAVAAGVSVQRLYSEQLSQAQQRYGHLRDDHALLQAQFKQVETQLAQLHDRCGPLAAAAAAIPLEGMT